MFPIWLTHRTITYRWNKETQAEDEVVTDESVYLNPERIAWFGPASDNPRKYTSRIRTSPIDDIFVVESPAEIADAIKAARYAVYLEACLGKTP